MRIYSVRRAVGYVLMGLGIALLLLLGVREIYAPRLTLHALELLTGASKPLDVLLSDDLELRLFSSTRPHVGKIAALQKGLVLVHEGAPLVEEGYGFGLPIIESQGTAYISRHADISMHRRGSQVSLIKSYHIDVADRPTQPFRRKYADVPPLGRVVFTYTVQRPDTIRVRVDFRDLRADWQRAYLMNEQGARNFTRYIAPDGRRYAGGAIGIWEEATAPFGCWYAPNRQVRFCVEAAPGQKGFVGRERYRQYNWLGFYSLSWSGIDLVVEAPMERFAYVIRVFDGSPRD